MQIVNFAKSCVRRDGVFMCGGMVLSLSLAGCCSMKCSVALMVYGVCMRNKIYLIFFANNVFVSTFARGKKFNANRNYVYIH